VHRAVVQILVVVTVKDGFGEAGVYAGSFGDLFSPPLSIGRACGFERGHMGPGLYWTRP
jgi:hypothetical protein